MTRVETIRNQDIERVLIGTPKDHKHLRICVELKSGTILVFQEATIANISRAYITLKTHPQIRAQELETKTIDEGQLNEGYARHQLIETSKTPEKVEEELETLLEASI